MERKMMRSLQPTEHEIQQLIINYLKFKGYYVQRMNSGAVKVTNRYGNQHMLMLSEKGTPDLMAFKPDKGDDGTGYPCGGVDLFFIEVKRPGKKPTPLQEAKMKELEEYGARCLVATCIEDLEKIGI